MEDLGSWGVIAEKSETTSQELLHPDRLTAFTRLELANQKIISSVKDFTRIDPSQFDLPEEVENIPKLVVLERRLPVSGETPDLLTVCVVRYTEEQTYHLESISESASFEFAFIPRRSLTTVLSQDLLWSPLKGVTKEDMVSKGTDVTYNQGSLKSRGIEYANLGRDKSMFAGLFYWLELKATANKLEQLRREQVWVLEAAQNPELNPHLN